MSHITYIDGTNLLFECAKAVGIKGARADKPSEDHLALACQLARQANPYACDPKRRYWFASYQGDETYRDALRESLQKQGFEAMLFKKNQGREKGVDISLTREMMVHAFQRNCIESILVAGDEDYVPLVNEVKRYGQRVLGYFFKGATAQELILNLDRFYDLTPNLSKKPAKEFADKFRRSAPTSAHTPEKVELPRLKSQHSR